MTNIARRELVEIGKALGTLNKDDVTYIMDNRHTECEANRRMITARQRSINKECFSSIPA